MLPQWNSSAKGRVSEANKKLLPDRSHYCELGRSLLCERSGWEFLCVPHPSYSQQGYALQTNSTGSLLLEKGFE